MSNNTNPRIALYKEAIMLEERRSSLHAELERIHSRLAFINSHLTGEPTPASAKAPAAPKPPARPALAKSASAKAVAPFHPGRRARRGELSKKILALLASAGKKGARVMEIAEKLGTKRMNIHSWFKDAGKRTPGVKKIGVAHYRLESSKAAASSSPKSGAKAPGAKKKKSTRPLSGRGELASKIVALLKEAGPNGIKVGDMARQLGVKNRNLFIWFSTTGRKNPAIEKIGEAHYKLNETPPAPSDQPQA